MFRNGHPADILGPPPPPGPTTREPLSTEGVDSNSDDDDSEEADSSAFSGSDNSDFAPSETRVQKRRRRKFACGSRHTFATETTLSRNIKAPVPWIEFDVVRGWTAVLRIFKLFSQQCDCAPLVSRNGNASKHCVTYRM